MSESLLSIKYSDLILIVSEFLGYGSVPDNLSETAQFDQIDRFIQSGIRQFYFPPKVDGIEAGYDWSFLHPTTTLDTVADQSENDLPDNCGRVFDCFYYEPDQHVSSIPLVSESRILGLLQQSTDTNKPQYASIRMKGDAVTETAGQRLEVMWWPIPNDAYTLTYKYEGYTGPLTDDLPYPLGGMRHAELITESCLAIAELRANDERGIHWDSFVDLLGAGIAQDRKLGAKRFGSMSGTEGGGAPSYDHNRRRATSDITYNGVPI